MTWEFHASIEFILSPFTPSSDPLPISSCPPHLRVLFLSHNSSGSVCAAHILMNVGLFIEAQSRPTRSCTLKGNWLALPPWGPSAVSSSPRGVGSWALRSPCCNADWLHLDGASPAAVQWSCHIRKTLFLLGFVPVFSHHCLLLLGWSLSSGVSILAFETGPLAGTSTLRFC